MTEPEPVVLPDGQVVSRHAYDTARLLGMWLWVTLLPALTVGLLSFSGILGVAATWFIISTLLWASIWRSVAAGVRENHDPGS